MSSGAPARERMLAIAYATASRARSFLRRPHTPYTPLCALHASLCLTRSLLRRPQDQRGNDAAAGVRDRQRLRRALPPPALSRLPRRLGRGAVSAHGVCGLTLVVYAALR